MLLFVGTPNLSARMNRIKNKLKLPGLQIEEQIKILTITTEFMESNWDIMRFLTFAESEVFANNIIDFGVRIINTLTI